MRLSKLYKSMLIYLLFCYGSKYAVTADAPKSGASTTNPPKTGGTLSLPSGGRSQSSPDAHTTQPPPTLTTPTHGGLSLSENNNLIDLDLNSKRSTNQVEYSKDPNKNVETYSAKNSLMFKKVTRGTNTVCEPKNNKYPNKLIVTQYSGGKTGMKLFYPGDGSYAGSSTPELVELDLNHPQNTDHYEYSNGTYTAKTGYAFSKVYKNGHFLKDFHDTYPIKVQIDNTDTGYLLLTVVYEENSTFFFLKDPDVLTSYTNGRSTSVTSTSFVLQASEVYVDHLKKVAGDDMGSSIVDTSKFSIETVGGLLNYTFKKGSKCTELDYDGQTVWKHDVAKHGNKYPTNVLFNTTTKFIMVDCTGVYQYFYSYYSNRWNQVSGFESKSIERLDLNKLKFVTLDSDGKIKHNDQTQFDKKEQGSIISYKFKEGSKCLEVKYGPHLVWDYVESQHVHKYPTKVTINIDTLLLTVDSSGNYRHSYSYFDNKFKQTFAYKTESIVLDRRKLKFMTPYSHGLTNEMDRTQFDKEERGPVCEYKFKPDSKCVEVLYDETTVWKYDSSIHGVNYPTSLTLNVLRNVVMVKSSDEYAQMFTYYEDKWSTGPSQGLKPQFKLGELKLITVDSDGSTKEVHGTKFERSKEGSIISYKFEDGSKCVQIKYFAYTVWKYDRAQHMTKYPTKVTFNMDTLSLTVDSSGNYRHFYSYFDNKFKQAFAYKPDLTELDPEKLEFITDGHRILKENFEYVFERKGSVVNCNFKTDSKCVEIKYNEETVWKHDGSIHGNKHPTLMVLNLETSVLVIKSSDYYTQMYSYYNDKWNVGPSYGLKSQFQFERLDIETLESDDTTKLNDDTKFDKEEQGTIVSYTFKPEARCTAIRYDNDLVWEHDENIYGYIYPTGLTMNASTSFLLVESRGQYQNFYSYYNGAWRPIVSHRTHDVAGSLDNRSLKLLTMSEDDTIVDMHESEYYLTESEHLYTYEFTDDAHCFRIQYGSILVWEYNPYMHKEHYPTSLAFNIKDRNIVIEAEHEYTHFFSFGGDQSRQAGESELDFNKLKLITQEGTAKKENDRTKFDRSESGSVLEYKFKTDSKCVEVKYDKTTVWKYDKSQHNNKYPTSIMVNIDKNLLTVDSSNNYKQFYSYSRGNFYHALASASGSKKSDSKKLKIVTKEADGSEKENDVSKYDLKTEENEDKEKVDVYEFKADSKCVKILYDDKTLWQHDSKNLGEQYPKMVEFNLEVKVAYIHVDLASFQQGQSVTTHEKFEVWVDTGVPRNLRHIKPTDADLKSKDSTNLLDCIIDETSKTRTYTARGIYAFNNVFQQKGSCNCCGSDNVVYEPSEKSDFAIQVVVFNTGKSDKQARMYLLPGTTRYFYKKKSENWNETERGEKDTDGNELITIDVDKNKLSNNLYEYKLENQKHVYTMKDGYRVKKVKTFKQLWQCKDGKYGVKVIVEHPETGKSGTSVNRASGYSRFDEYDPDVIVISDISQYKFDKEKLKLYTKNDKNQLVQLTSGTHFNVKDEFDGSTKYDLLGNSKCVKVQYGTETVWEHNSTHNGQYPVNLNFLPNGMFKVAVNGKIDEKDLTSLLNVNKDGGSQGSSTTPKPSAGQATPARSAGQTGGAQPTTPKSAPTGTGQAQGSTPVTQAQQTGTAQSQGPPATPPTQSQPAKPAQASSTTGSKSDASSKTGAVLDVKKKSNTNHFDYSKNNNIGTYTPKQGYGFKLVKHEQTEIWKTDKSNEYAIKVVMGISGNVSNYLTIFLPNNVTKAFVKDGDSWKEIGPHGDELDSEGNILISINLKIDSESNDRYEYIYQDGKQVYTLKSGFKVKRIRTDKQLWVCSDDSYGRKVVVKPLEDIDKGKFGTTVERTGGYSTFNVYDPLTGSVLTDQLDKSKVRLYTKDDQDKLVELVSGTHFKVKHEYDGSTKYALFKDSKCVTVKYGSETVWEHNSSHEGQYPTNVYFMANGLVKVSVNRTFDEKVIRRLLKVSYKDEEDLDRNLIKLDVSEKESTEHIEYSKDNNIETYTAKGNFLIQTVKRGNRIIWRSYNGAYPNKLTVTQGTDGKSSMKLSYGEVVSPPPKKQTQTSQQKTGATSGTGNPTGAAPAGTPAQSSGQTQSGSSSTPKPTSGQTSTPASQTQTTPSGGSSQTGGGQSQPPKATPTGTGQDTPKTQSQGAASTPTPGQSQGSTPTSQAQTAGGQSAPKAQSQGSSAKPKASASGSPTTPSGGSSQSSGAKSGNLSGSSAKSGKPK